MRASAEAKFVHWVTFPGVSPKNIDVLSMAQVPSLSLSHTHSLTHSLTLSLSHTHTLTHSLSLSHSLTHAVSGSHRACVVEGEEPRDGGAPTSIYFSLSVIDFPLVQNLPGSDGDSLSRAWAHFSFLRFSSCLR